MPSIAYQETITLETEECCACGVTFGMPKYFKTKLRETGGTFYCPNGHSLHYGASKVKKLEDELEQKLKELTAARCETVAERHKREEAEKQLKRHKTRTKNGVCPCCQRSFVNLQRHIASQHPNF